MNKEREMLTEKEFYTLKTIAFETGQVTQRELVEATGYSLGTINKIINDFIGKEYIDSDYKLKPDGKKVLENYEVRNAIILAAGMTSDNNPIARNIPKGLFIVKGEVLIERLIKQLKSAGIENIYVVIGFRMDQFFYLEEKYGVQLVPNSTYLSRNNNGSIYCVRQELGNSYIVPNDEYFETNVFCKYEYNSYYAVVRSESKSKEAFVRLDDTDRITGVYKGGESGWTMLGHSYLSIDFCEKYISWLEAGYDRYETKRMFWEEIFYPHLSEIELHAKKYDKGVIHEFDELAELKGFDDQFINNINPEIYDLIGKIFNASKVEITGISPVSESSVDILFKFKVRNDEFVFRYPSKESIDIINYSLEESNNKLAKQWGLDDSFVYENRRGYKISLVTSPVDDLSFDNCIELLLRMQSKDKENLQLFDYRERIRTVLDYLDDSQRLRLQKFADIEEGIAAMLTMIEDDHWDKRFSHNSISKSNFRFCDFNLILTDWRFAGVNDIGYDIAALASLFADDAEMNDKIIARFMDVSPETKRHLYACSSVAAYYKFLLGIYYSDSENEFSNDLYRNWKTAVNYLNKAEELCREKQSEYLTNEQVLYVEEKIQEKFTSISPLSGGVTNTTYELVARSGKKYAVRIPGKGTNEYINRPDEMNNISKVNPLGIMPKVSCADPQTGILIMDFVEDSQACSMEDFYNVRALQRICHLLSTVHTSGIKFGNEFDIPVTQDMYRKHLKEIGGKIPESLQREEKRMDEWMQYLFREYPKKLVPCHIDPKLNNFLKKGRQLYLIDWEYSGMADLYFELANFTLTNNLTPEEEKIFIDAYCKASGIEFIREKYLLYKFATDYLWIYWHLIKCQQNSMVEYNEMSWNKRLKRAQKVLAVIEKESM